MKKGKQKNGVLKARKKSGAVLARRALNAFHIDKGDIENEAVGDHEQSDQDPEEIVDDEDIDSDEAFDSSDEERYSSFKFSGGSSKSYKVALSRQIGC
jgi:U3 small nucleolar RNA-associated protein 14